MPSSLRLARLMLTLGATACATDPATGPAPSPPVTDVRALPFVFPGAADPWNTVSPAALGWDTTALRSALEWAGTQRSTAVLITWRGHVVAEQYWRGWTTTTDSIIASAGKSVLATLIGQLLTEGRLGLDTPVAQYLGTGWSRSPATEPRITVRHLLQMASGLDDSLAVVVAPGDRFYYNNPAYYQLFAVAARASGQDIHTASRTRLFAPVGMGCIWRFNVDTGEPGFILSCTARDMARFGLLTLARGRWGTTRVVDSSWVARMWTPAGHDNPAYGLLWWLNGSAGHRIPGPYALPTLGGPLVPSAPRDLVAALGKGDKKIYVVPSLDLVVVRHGDQAVVSGGLPAAASAFDEQFWQRLRAAIRY